MLKNVLAIVTVLAMAAVAQAAITDIHWSSVNGDPAVTGSVQNTLLTTTTADWTNAEITVTLTQGSLLDPVATKKKWTTSTVVANDTWLALPGYANTDAEDNGYDVTVQTFNLTTAKFVWFDTANLGAVSGIAARLYASDSAQGTWTVKMWDRSSAGVATVATGSVTDGAFAPVPEPATMAILGLGAMGLIRRRQ